MQPHLTATDEHELDAFWSRPARPMSAINQAFTPGSVSITTTCRACGKRSQQATHLAGLLCNVCRNDLDQTEAKLNEQLQSIALLEAALSEAWIQRQAELPDELAERWYKLSQDKQRIDNQLQKAETAKQYENAGTLTEIVQRVAHLQTERDTIYARIERTRLKGGDLALLIEDERNWQRAQADMNAKRRDVQQGLQEVSAARDEGVSF